MQLAFFQDFFLTISTNIIMRLLYYLLGVWPQRWDWFRGQLGVAMVPQITGKKIKKKKKIFFANWSLSKKNLALNPSSN
jgi:hypothetical protein